MYTQMKTNISYFSVNGKVIAGFTDDKGKVVMELVSDGKPFVDYVSADGEVFASPSACLWHEIEYNNHQHNKNILEYVDGSFLRGIDVPMATEASDTFHVYLGHVSCMDDLSKLLDSSARSVDKDWCANVDEFVDKCAKLFLSGYDKPIPFTMFFWEESYIIIQTEDFMRDAIAEERKALDEIEAHLNENHVF